MTKSANAFNWSGPSQIVKPKRKTRSTPMDAKQRTERVLRMRHVSAYLKAQPTGEAS